MRLEHTEAQNSAQMVFCDLSTAHGNGAFNVYDDLKNKLMERGIPEAEIAYIYGASTEARKKELFRKVRSGQIILIAYYRCNFCFAVVYYMHNSLKRRCVYVPNCD